MFFSFKKRRLFSYSLRFLLASVTIVAIMFGLYMNRVRQQRIAVEKLRAKGYSVAYEHQYGGKPRNSSVPKWLEDYFGTDFFHAVYHVEFREKPFDSEAFELLKEFPDLHGLFIYSKENISPETYDLIACSRSLDYLYLGAPTINAEHFKKLTVLKNLKTLYLYDKISDDVLKSVAQLDGLEQLHIDNENISEEGIYQLHVLPRLTFIKLYGGYDISSDLQRKMKNVAIDDGSFRRSLYSGSTYILQQDKGDVNTLDIAAQLEEAKKQARTRAMPKTTADIGRTPKPEPESISTE